MGGRVVLGGGRGGGTVKGGKGKGGKGGGGSGPIAVIISKSCAVDLYLALAHALGITPYGKKGKKKKGKGKKKPGKPRLPKTPTKPTGPRRPTKPVGPRIPTKPPVGGKPAGGGIKGR